MMKFNESFEIGDNNENTKVDYVDTMIEIGKLNYETPINHFLQIYYKRDINCYIFHKEIILNDQRDQQFIFILHDDILITTKFEDDSRYLNTESSCNNANYDNPILMKIDYKTIHGIDLEYTNGNKNLTFKLIRSDNFATFTNLMISLPTLKDLYTIYHLIEKQKMTNWQIFFEYKIPIQTPFYYQKHFFLQKVNKRGKQQSRVIVFTNKFIMNVSFKVEIRPSVHFELEKQKWSLAIESVKSLSVLKKKPLTILMTMDKSINKKIVEENKMKLKNKNEREFLFYNETDLKQFIFQCRRLYYTLKNSFLFVNIS